MRSNDYTLLYMYVACWFAVIDAFWCAIIYNMTVLECTCMFYNDVHTCMVACDNDKKYHCCDVTGNQLTYM